MHLLEYFSNGVSGRVVRLVIVEDNDELRKTLSLYLRMHHYLQVCAEAATGEEGIEAAKDHQPHLVLLDLELPGMDGFEATRAIRKVCPRTQCLMLSGYSGQPLLREASRAGASGYIVKGQPDAVCASIRRALAGEAFFVSATPEGR